MDDYIAPHAYSAAESCQLAYLLARGAKAAANGGDTSKWDRRIDELRASAVDRERREKDAAEKAKADAAADRAAVRAKRRTESRWW